MESTLRTGIPWLDQQHYIQSLSASDIVLITGDPQSFRSGLAAMLAAHAAQTVGVTIYTGRRTVSDYLALLDVVAAAPGATGQLALTLYPGVPKGYTQAVDDAALRGDRLLVIDDADWLRSQHWVMHQPLLRAERQSPAPALVLVDQHPLDQEQGWDSITASRWVDHALSIVRGYDGVMRIMLLRAQGWDVTKHDAQCWSATTGWQDEGLMIAARSITTDDLAHDRPASMRQIAALLRSAPV